MATGEFDQVSKRASQSYDHPPGTHTLPGTSGLPSRQPRRALATFRTVSASNWSGKILLPIREALIQIEIALAKARLVNERAWRYDNFEEIEKWQATVLSKSLMRTSTRMY